MNRKAFAKINLGLDVLRKREDGYHMVDMILQEIDLWDMVELIPNASGNITLSAQAGPSFPLDGSNLVYKAAKIMQDTFSLEAGMHIHVEKHIPMEAGLAGGSADAAAVLHLVNEAFGLQADLKQLQKLGLFLGADIPFCLAGGTMRGQGIGENLTPLRPLKEGLLLLVAKPREGLSTGRVYTALDQEEGLCHPDMEALARAVSDWENTPQGLQRLTAATGNVMERTAIRMLPKIGELQRLMLAQGALCARMSGSGPTVFGIFPSEEARERCFALLEQKKELADFLCKSRTR